MTTQEETLDEKRQIALELLPELKQKIGPEGEAISDHILLRFLHWKLDVNRAYERFEAHQKWRKENPWAYDSDPPLLIHKDQTLRRVLESDIIVAPQGLKGKEGNMMLLGRLRNNDMSDGRTAKDVVRMALYMIDRAMEDENTQINGVNIFHDLNGISTNNVSPQIPKLLFGAIIGHFPVRIGGAYLLNAPFFFRGIFSVVSLMMPSKLRKRIHFVNKLEEVPIELKDHLKEYGGENVHDNKEWVKTQIQREEDKSMLSFSGCLIEK